MVAAGFTTSLQPRGVFTTANSSEGQTTFKMRNSMTILIVINNTWRFGAWKGPNASLQHANLISKRLELGHLHGTSNNLHKHPQHDITYYTSDHYDPSSYDSSSIAYILLSLFLYFPFPISHFVLDSALADPVETAVHHLVRVLVLVTLWHESNFEFRNEIRTWCESEAEPRTMMQLVTEVKQQRAREFNEQKWKILKSLHFREYCSSDNFEIRSRLATIGCIWSWRHIRLLDPAWCGNPPGVAQRQTRFSSSMTVHS